MHEVTRTTFRVVRLFRGWFRVFPLRQGHGGQGVWRLEDGESEHRIKGSRCSVGAVRQSKPQLDATSMPAEHHAGDDVRRPN